MNKVNYWIFFILSILCLACTKDYKKLSSPKLKAKIGKEIVDIINSPTSTTLFLTSLGKGNTYIVKSNEIILKINEINSLRVILLNDGSYIFNATKSAIFAPQVGMKFRGKNNEEIVVLFSFSSNQVKFINGTQVFILDFDPVKDELTSNLNTLIKNIK